MVWSGAQLFPRSVTHEFKVSNLQDGSLGLSFVLGRNLGDFGYPLGAHLVLDSSYNIRSIINSTDDQADMHEFLIGGDGRTACHVIHTTVQMDIEIPEREFSWKGIILTSGFREIDLMTGEVLFEWWASNHTDVRESSVGPVPGDYVRIWENV